MGGPKIVAGIIAVILVQILGPVFAAVEGQTCTQASYNNQDYCDTDATKLECYFGRCSCPRGKFYRNVPLNTYWYEPWGKCVSLPQSSCDLSVFANGGGIARTGYQCQPGMTCRNQYQFTDPNVGICRSSIMRPGILHLLLLVILLSISKVNH